MGSNVLPVKYADVRAAMASGDVVFFQSNHWKARLVRWWTKSPFSHVGILFCVAGRVFVLEAVLNGVRIYPLSKEARFWHAPRFVDWGVEAEEFAMSKVSEPYSQFWAVLAGAGFRLPDDGMWQCAEFVRQVLLRCLMPTWVMAKLANAQETPSAIAQWVDGCGVALTEIVNER